MGLFQSIKKRSGIIIIALLIALFVFVVLIDYILVTIYPGEAGVLFRRLIKPGTVIDKVYDEGLQTIFPWNEMYVYDIRIQEKKQTVDVLSRNGLTIQVVVSIRYHLVRGQLPYLHKRVGPEYLDKIIIPSIISSVREVVGEYRPEEIYTTARHLIQDKLLIEQIEETGRIPIVYDDVIVENIKLPTIINNAIEMKLKQQQEFLEYEYRLKKAEREIERKQKEAIGIKQYQNIISESLSPELLEWKGIMATLELSKSDNSKVIIVGSGKNGLPIIFNADSSSLSQSYSGNEDNKSDSDSKENIKSSDEQMKSMEEINPSILDNSSIGSETISEDKK